MPDCSNSPRYLELPFYDDVSTLMVGDAVDRMRPNAAVSLLDHNQRLAIDHNFEVAFDQSFAGQMSVIAGTVDLYLLTANSAIPVADSIRGYHEELGLVVPHIDIIRASGRASKKYYDGTLCGSGRAEADFEAEVEDTRERLGEADSVCVIDQFVNTGQTLRYAGTILREAGIGSVSTMAIRGNWYDDADPSEIDYTHISSAHAEAMRDIGRLAAQTPV